VSGIVTFDGVLFPRDVDATQLIATFTVSPAATVEVEGVEQTDGETRNDFTDVIRYTVIAEDQSRSTYSIYLGRLLDDGEVIGWQRDAGDFRFFSDPRDITLLEELHPHLDSVFPQIADTLHATVTNPIRVDIYPSHAAFLDHLRSLGWTPEDWYIGTALSAEWILVESSNSPDNQLTSGDVASLVTHEAIHSIIFTFGTPVPQWLHEGLAGLDAALLEDCFPDCTANLDGNYGPIAHAASADVALVPIEVTSGA